MSAVGARTIPEALDRAAASAGAGIGFHLPGGERWLSLDELRSRAEGGAEALRRLGIEPGQPVAIMGPNSPQWATWAFSAWFAGAVVTPIQYPLRVRDAEGLRRSTRRLLDVAGCRVAMADESFRQALGEAWRPWNLPGPAPGPFGPRLSPEPDDPAVLQLTSGSTAAPRGVVIQHRSVTSDMAKYAAQPGQPFPHHQVSWLPFFHDWGLFGQLLRPIFLGWGSDIMPTESFARGPGSWLRVATRVAGTWLDAPPSAWAVAFRSALRDPSGIDLSAVRRATHGAETIPPALIDHMRNEGHRIGLASEAIHAAYGMAEATLTLSQTTDDQPLEIDSVDRARLTEAGVAAPSSGPAARRVVSCGPPMPGVELRIVDPETKAVLPERSVGEVWARGRSIMRGYVGTDVQPFEDGFLRTGDLGYTADGQVFITGRIKDVVIVLGRNYAPEDFEWAAQRVPGVKADRVVAFAATEVSDGAVVLVLEAQSMVEVRDLARDVRHAVGDAVGVTPWQVLVVKRGTIPKTTSGKLRRGAVREAFVRGELEPAGAASPARDRLRPTPSPPLERTGSA